jgi:hypothetical protein
MRHGVDDVSHHPVGNPKRKVYMMSTSASFSLSKKPRFIEFKKKPNSSR